MTVTKIHPASRLLIPVGLIAITLPVFLKNLLPVPDFVQGFSIGLGLVFEYFGLSRMTFKRH